MQLKKSIFIQSFLLLSAFTFLTGLPLAQARDRDNNPPGPIGGRGTNWENPPGRAGGPGASPDRRHWHGNPPGLAGGPGYGPQWDAWFEKHSNLRSRIDRNNDGVIDGREWRLAHDRWPHLNPPGPIGGPGAGTRWKDN